MASTTTTYHVVEGWTSPIDIDLRDDGAIPSGTLAGTIELILKDSSGTQLPFTGDVSIQDATNWRVRVNPDAADFVAGIYRGRVKVTDGTGKIAFFPNSEPDIWVVRTETPVNL